MSTPPDLAQLGLASAALMHDLQAMVGALREQAALVVDDLEGGHLPVASARAVVERCDEIQGLVRDVVAAAAGDPPAAAFDPVGCVHGEISRISQRAAALHVACRAALPGGVWVEGSRTLLERSLGNLLRNAARHARERIEVRLSLEEAGGAPELLISVEDDGSGVAGEVRDRLFTPGARTGGSGAGLGLASARWAMERLGGRVLLAEPVALGGARFELRLPARRPGGDAAAGPAAAASRPLAGRTVAVVDDDEMVLRSVVRLLAHGGARVVTADPGGLTHGVGLEELAASAPDVVLLDQHLGSVSGVEVWHRMNARFPELARRVAFFSGAAGWGAEDPDMGATGRPVIAKGMDLGDLIGVVDRLVRGCAV